MQVVLQVVVTKATRQLHTTGIAKVEGVAKLTKERELLLLPFVDGIVEVLRVIAVECGTDFRRVAKTPIGAPQVGGNGTRAVIACVVLPLYVAGRQRLVLVIEGADGPVERCIFLVGLQAHFVGPATAFRLVHNPGAEQVVCVSARPPALTAKVIIPAVGP